MKRFTGILRRLTLVDYITLGLIALIVLSIFLFLRRGNTVIPITVKVTNPDVLSQYARPNNEYVLSFVPGDVELNELGQVTSTLQEVKTIYSSVDFPAMYLTLNVKVIYSPLKKQYSLKGKPIVYGQGYSFTFSNVKFDGIVVDFPGFRTSEVLEEDTVIIKARLKEDSRMYSDVYGVLPFVAESVKEGDEVKDQYGNTLAKVLEVAISPAKRTVVSSEGNARLIEDPLLKDVIYKLEIKARRTSIGVFYNDYIVLQIGETIPLTFKNISVYPTVTEILD